MTAGAGPLADSGALFRMVSLGPLQVQSTFTNCSFQENVAWWSHGGALTADVFTERAFSKAPLVQRLLFCQFFRNRAAEDGGGIHIWSGVLSIQNNTVLHKNTAANAGGGVAILRESEVSRASY
eukprot:1190923-Prorocentrum_minimum.AAC.1